MKAVMKVKLLELVTPPKELKKADDEVRRLADRERYIDEATRSKSENLRLAATRASHAEGEGRIRRAQADLRQALTELASAKQKAGEIYDRLIMIKAK